MNDQGEQEETTFEGEALHPLSRLPRLGCLQLSLRLSVDGFCFLCSLPLTRLCLSDCCVDALRQPRNAGDGERHVEGGADAHCTRPPLAGSSALHLRRSAHGYADSIAAATGCGTASQPQLQRLIGDWSGRGSISATARIPSLTELLLARGRHLVRTRRICPHCSPRTCSRCSHSCTRCVSLTWASIACHRRHRLRLPARPLPFLTAYSAQLQVLTLMVYSPDSTARLMESALQCSQLRSLTIGYGVFRLRTQLPEHYVDVEQLDQAVAALPPLRLLRAAADVALVQRARDHSIPQQLPRSAQPQAGSQRHAAPIHTGASRRSDGAVRRRVPELPVGEPSLQM